MAGTTAVIPKKTSAATIQAVVRLLLGEQYRAITYDGEKYIAKQVSKFGREVRAPKAATWDEALANARSFYRLAARKSDAAIIEGISQ